MAILLTEAAKLSNEVPRNPPPQGRRASDRQQTNPPFVPLPTSKVATKNEKQLKVDGQSKPSRRAGSGLTVVLPLLYWRAVGSQVPSRNTPLLRRAMNDKPRSFSYHWGSGYVAEQAQVESPHHRPTLQLLRYTEGEAAGQVGVRFCHYSHRGMFQRSPLLMSPEDIDAMHAALDGTPELKALLRRLVA